MNTINGTSQINGYYNLTQIQLQKLLEEQEQAKQQECDSIQISQQAGNIASGLMQPPQFDSSILDNLVEDGTLTQEQADAVQSAFESNGINNTYKNKLTYGSEGNMMNSTAPFDSLINSETITEDQKSSIQNALLSTIQQNTRSGDIQRGVNPLDSLVEDGTLTQEQEDEIIKSLGNSSSNEESISDILSQLVEDGIITDEQSQLSKTTLLSALTSNEEDEETKINPLDALVEDGTITKEIKDEIIKNMGKPAPAKAKEDDEEEEDNSVTSISTSAQKSYLDNLVEAGVITQAQEDKILEALEG
nr:hypothetical protein [Clostridium neonatale]